MSEVHRHILIQRICVHVIKQCQTKAINTVDMGKYGSEGLLTKVIF